MEAKIKSQAEYEAALERIAHRMMLQPQWVEDRAELGAARN